MKIPEFKLDENFSAKKQMGVRNRIEADFKKKKVIPFLKTFPDGVVVNYTYLSKFYSEDPGIPDLFFYYRGQTYGIETKTNHGVVSEDQKRMHARLTKAGVIIIILYPLVFEAFKQTMKERCMQ